MTNPPERRADGDGGSSDDDRQPDDVGQTGTLGEHADDRPVPRKSKRAKDQKSRSATSDQRSR